MLMRLFILLSAIFTLAAEEGLSGGGGGGGTNGGGGSTPGGASGNFLTTMLPMLLPFGLILWFMVIRPQRKEEAKRKELMGALKRGDRVVTIGGVHGLVVAVGETTVDLNLAVSGDEVVVRYNKGAISSHVGDAAAAATTAKA